MTNSDFLTTHSGICIPHGYIPTTDTSGQTTHTKPRRLSQGVEHVDTNEFIRLPPGRAKLHTVEAGGAFVREFGQG